MLKLKLTGLIIFTCILHSFSQTNIWYFGNNAGLKFNLKDGTTSPEGGSKMSTNEGCTAATDNSGNLLFYGDGQHLWHGDNTTEITSKDNLMLGSPSSTQAAIIVPLPGNACTKFLVFTTEDVEKIKLSNATGLNGLGVALVTVSGSAAPKHKVDLSPAVSVTGIQTLAFSEKLAVTSDGTGGWWLVAHDYNLGNTGTTGNAFYTYHITNTNEFTTAQSSADIKSALAKNLWIQNKIINCVPHNNSMYNAQGQMKFTKDGTKLGLVLAGDKIVQIYSFNQKTGEIIVDKTIQVGNTNTNNTYGFEFSPDGTKIYVGEGYGNNSTSNLYQYDITATIPTRNTLSTIPSATTSSRYAFNGMQLGPDNRIYICGPYEKNSRLSVINTPNSSGTSSGYSAWNISYSGVPGGVPISGPSTLNLPTVIAAQVSCEPTTTSQGCNCSGVTASLSSLSLTSQAGNATASLLLSSGSNKIKKIRVTLVNYIVTPSSDLCKNYSTMSNDNFGKFVAPAGTLKDYASVFSPYQQNTAAQSSSDVEFTTATPRVITNESITFNLKFPPILALPCCSQTVSACFRVEFIDDNCKICDVILCNSMAPRVVAQTYREANNAHTERTNTRDLQPNSDMRLQVYPNPNTGNFTINTSQIGTDCKYQLISVEGKEIQSGEIRGESHEINSNIAPGMYSVYVFKENQVFTEKIMISRD